MIEGTYSEFVIIDAIEFMQFLQITIVSRIRNQFTALFLVSAVSTFANSFRRWGLKLNHVLNCLEISRVFQLFPP